VLAHVGVSVRIMILRNIEILVHYFTKMNTCSGGWQCSFSFFTIKGLIILSLKLNFSNGHVWLGNYFWTFFSLKDFKELERVKYRVAQNSQTDGHS
jgi:hypothetical protein